MSSQRRLAALTSIFVLSFTVVAGPVAGQGWVSRKGGSGQGSDVAVLGANTIRYDPGTPADVMFPGPNRIVGNRCDSGSGQPLMPGTVTAIAAYWGGEDATYPVLAALNTANTVIFGLAYAGGQAPFTFNTFDVSWPVPSVFMGIVLASNYFPSLADSVGLRYASTLGQGFHAAYASNVVGAPFNTIPSANAMVRVSGDLVVPVALMRFEVE